MVDLSIFFSSVGSRNIAYISFIQIADEAEIRLGIKEAEARLELAVHYNIPYPRPMNFPQHQVTTKSTQMKGSQRKLKGSTPVYLRSSYEETESKAS